MKTAAWIVVAFLAVGVLAGGGLVRRPDGTVDVGATLEQGADKGGELAGQTADDLGNGLGNGIGSAVSSSDLAKVGVAAAAVGGVIKYGPKFSPKPNTKPALTPTPSTQPQPRRRTGWCADVVTGAVQPCEPVKSTTPSSTSTTAVAPMSPGFTAPTFRLPEATWKPCVATPGLVINC